MCFGSFIVAILVGALNKVIANEEREIAEIQRDESLPVGYVNAGGSSVCWRITAFLHYVLSTKLYGIHGPKLVRRLEEQVARFEHADESGVAATEQLMLNAQQCVRILGEKPAARLLGAHGARRLEAEQVLEA